MPYTVKGPDDEGKFQVLNEDGEVKAKHASEDDAKKQVKLLHMIEKEHG